MSLVFHLKSYSFFSLVLALLLSLIVVPQVWAHGGEDHGEQKPVTAQTNANLTLRVIRVGDYEVTLKHPQLEPDKELAARIFVTRFENNEPIKDAKVVLSVEGESSPKQITATETDTAGLYEVKLPPMPQGDYKLIARLEISGSSLTADFGSTQVRVAVPETPADSATWARTALIVLGVLLLLVFLGVLVLFALRYGRRAKSVEEETVAA